MWRQNPTTKLVLQFLHDYRVQLADGIAQAVFKGKPVKQDYLDEVAFKCGVMEDVETLEADDINQFYGIETPQQSEEKKETKNV